MKIRPSKMCVDHTIKTAKFISSGTALPKRNAKQLLGQCSINASIIYLYIFAVSFSNDN